VQPLLWHACAAVEAYDTNGFSTLPLQVAEVRGYDSSLITPIPSPAVASGATPADISMDTSALTDALGIQLTSLHEALVQMWGMKSGTPEPGQ
jgi:hypothetical protein